jgi:vacuolar protein sorting-associated protein 29
VICTGNIGNRETTDWLKTICGEVHLVRGDFDSTDLPQDKTVTIGSWKIHVTHGHQITPWGDAEALKNYQRQVDCDILITGHSHVMFVGQLDDKVFLNPGSVTGAYTPFVSEVRPSFLLTAVQDRELTVFKYELVDEDDMSVTKETFSK